MVLHTNINSPENQDLTKILLNKVSQENTNNKNVNISLRDLVMVFRRHAKVISGIMIFTLCLAGTYLLVSTPKYTAEAVLQINVQKTNVVNIESVMSGITSDEAQVQSQLDVIGSRNLVGRVVDLLGLVRNPEFSPDVNNGSLKAWFKKLIKKDDATDEVEDEKDSQEKLEIRSATISNVLKNLNVVRNPKSYTLVVKFTSTSPQRAALIANTFVNEYLKGQLSVKFDATKRANDWLNDKLGELQTKVRDSEVLVQAFREKHGLIETSGVTITEQQLSELNSQLILARTEKAQAMARLEGAGGDNESSTDVLSAPLIQNLRNQEAEVLRKRSDLSSQYGPKHPKIINVNAELADLRAKIDVEIKKVKGSLENEVNIATAREKALSKSLDELQNKTGLSMKARIELDELERQKNANKALYQSFLSRSKETSEGQGLERPDAFVISDAEIPLRPSYPVKLLVMVIALFVGVFISGLAVLILEHLDNAISSSSKAEEVTGVDAIGMVPELDKGVNIINYLVKRPSSAFAEALRSILTVVHFSNPDEIPKVIMVTSSVPKEGKSSFVLSFATLVAKSGKKVLLIDADMKRPTIAKNLKKEFEFGLSDLLMGTATAEQVISQDERTGFDFIQSHPNTVNSHNLLGSNKMKTFLDNMRGKYDMIIVDTPPVMAISDCIVLSGIVDTALFVIRWQKTPCEIVKTAIKQLSAFNVNIAGVVLSRVDMEKQSKYSYGDKGNYYKNYSEYYAS